MRWREKGFSLIELIIVIAIMAILVGFLAPMYIKYLEKTKVSSDLQLADRIQTSVIMAITDAKIKDDPVSQPYLTMMETTGMKIDDPSFVGHGSVLEDSLHDSIGADLSSLKSQVRSEHGSDMEIWIYTTNGQVKVHITCTDVTAKKDTSNSTPNNDIIVQ